MGLGLARKSVVASGQWKRWDKSLALGQYSASARNGNDCRVRGRAKAEVDWLAQRQNVRKYRKLDCLLIVQYSKDYHWEWVLPRQQQTAQATGCAHQTRSRARRKSEWIFRGGFAQAWVNMRIAWKPRWAHCWESYERISAGRTTRRNWTQNHQVLGQS